MPKLSNIKFQKLDQYDNPVFIAGEENDLENYTILKVYAKKLNSMFEGFMPIYHNDEHKFGTIRFAKKYEFKPENNCNYDIEYSIKQKNKNLKIYVNCHITKITFVSRNIIDQGSDVFL